MQKTIERVAWAIADVAGMKLEDIDPAVVRAAIAAMPGWQPISTAPKDGTLILAVRFDQVGGKHVVGAIVHWSRIEEKWFSLTVGAYLVPTHWMPLPTPPEVQS